MSDIIKNPNRNRPRPIESRQLEHERLGLTPTPYPGNYAGSTAAILSNIAAFKAKPNDNNKIVNNEIDNFFTNDQEILNTPSIKDGGHIIDNNEYMSYDCLSNDNVESSNLDFNDEVALPDVGQYILMISGKIILSGFLIDVEEKIRSILYDEDIDYKNTPQEDIIVLKRIEIKVGVFIQE